MHRMCARVVIMLMTALLAACGTLSQSLQSSQRVGVTAISPPSTDGSRQVIMNPAWVIRPGSGTALLSLGAEWRSQRPDEVVLVVRLSTVNYQPVTSLVLHFPDRQQPVPPLDQVVILSEFALPDSYTGLKQSEREFRVSRADFDALMAAPAVQLRVGAGGREYVGDLRARSTGNITAGQSLPGFAEAVRAVEAGTASR